MALVPLAWLGILKLRGRTLDVGYWWLAGVFVVSWLADLGAHFTSPWVTSIVYPISQAAIVAAVFLVRRDAFAVLVLLLVTGLMAVVAHGASGPDLVLRCVAWGIICYLLWPLWQLGHLRTALLVSFGLGLAAWIAYVIRPGWPTWLVYQAVRAVGIAWFCLACAKPEPKLAVVRS